MKHFNSYDKDKFVVGKEYYTYYWDETNRGNAIKDYTGIMLVKVISNNPTQFALRGYTKFEILESKLLSKTIERNIHTYMHGYGLASTEFFENYEDCVEHHDKRLIDFAKSQNTKDRNVLLNKLVNKDNKPKPPSIETESIEWYKGLSKNEKKYVTWIKHFYSEL